VDDVKKVHPAEAIRKARGYADEVLALAGGDKDRADPADGTTPCEGRRGELSETVYYAWVGVTVAPVPEEQQLPTLRRLREHWQQQGYTITTDRVFSAGRRGEVDMENPADEFQVSVISTEPPTAFAVRISSPCYESDQPYHPVAPTTSTPR
jgi:hypothetical protein